MKFVSHDGRGSVPSIAEMLESELETASYPVNGTWKWKNVANAAEIVAVLISTSVSARSFLMRVTNKLCAFVGATPRPLGVRPLE